VRDILDTIGKWWDSGETFGLATVVATFRSAPRDPGAALAVEVGGEVIGSVSGGCVEGAVYELSNEVIEAGQLVCEIGLAVVKPAEFVVFRLAQLPSGTSAVNE